MFSRSFCIAPANRFAPAELRDGLVAPLVSGRTLSFMIKSRREAGVICSVVVVLLAFSNIPLLYGYIHKTPGLRFMGIFAGVRDANVYFMMMIQGIGASPIIENYFRPGEPNTIYHGLFWFFLGKLACWFHAPNLAMYHACRIAATITFVPLFYWGTARFLSSAAERLTALVVVCFGAGAGWLLMILRHQQYNLPFLPADVWTPEASAFYSLMAFPHTAISLNLILLCMVLAWDAIDSERAKPAWAAGLCGLILGFINAFQLLVVCFGLMIFLPASTLLRYDKASFRPGIIFGSLAVWPLGYYTFILIARPGALPGAVVRSPTPLAYLVGFGPVILLGLVRIVFLLRSRNLPRSDLFLFCWIIASSILMYSYPVLTQEARAVLGIQLPLGILAVRSLFLDILPAFRLDLRGQRPGPRRKMAAVIVSAFVIFALPSSFYNVFDRVARLKNYPESFSLTNDEYEALEYLRGVRGNDIVISGEWVGIYVPRVARKRVWVGQYDYPSYKERIEFIKKFFGGSIPDIQHYEMLRDRNIRFVFYGSDERRLGGSELGKAPYLVRLFKKGIVEIYEAPILNSQGPSVESLESRDQSWRRGQDRRQRPGKT